mmetsp:Transcript_6574/g.16359  ORF Transcript_6574/g.16359 Transcript_6574/m.16359 type:complete len:184 (-) Transcript_6574:1470-2021(-)
MFSPSSPLPSLEPVLPFSAPGVSHIYTEDEIHCGVAKSTTACIHYFFISVFSLCLCVRLQMCARGCVCVCSLFLLNLFSANLSSLCHSALFPFISIKDKNNAASFAHFPSFSDFFIFSIFHFQLPVLLLPHLQYSLSDRHAMAPGRRGRPDISHLSLVYRHVFTSVYSLAEHEFVLVFQEELC